MIHLSQHTSLSRLHDLEPHADDARLLRSSTATFWQRTPNSSIRTRVQQLKGSLRVTDGQVEALAQGLAHIHQEGHDRPGVLLVVLQLEGEATRPEEWSSRILICTGSDLFCSRIDVTVETFGARLVVCGVAPLPPLDHHLRESDQRLMESHFPPRSRPSYPRSHDPEDLDLTFRLEFASAVPTAAGR